MGMIGRRQLKTLLLHRPFIVPILTARLMLSQGMLRYLLKRNEGEAPLGYYTMGRDILLHYSHIEWSKLRPRPATVDDGTLKRLMDIDHGSAYFQRSVVKWNCTLYALCRTLKPATVVETGVFWGLSSSHILQAMRRNRQGTLHSIDVTPDKLLERGLQSGVIVPMSLRDRWNLILERSDLVLPDLLVKLGTVDVFIHDSDHSYENMMFEYEQAWPFIRPGGLLLSHDVDPDGSPFIDFANRVGARYYVKDLIGIAVRQ